jgi:hypothetical protein
MNTPENASPRQRLKALLAIPDSQRTEAQWDEIFELEITLAPGNREDDARQVQRDRPPQRDKPPVSAGSSPKPSGGGQGKRPPRRFKKRPKVEAT